MSLFDAIDPEAHLFRYQLQPGNAHNLWWPLGHAMITSRMSGASHRTGAKYVRPVVPSKYASLSLP